MRLVSNPLPDLANDIDDQHRRKLKAPVVDAAQAVRDSARSLVDVVGAEPGGAHGREIHGSAALKDSVSALGCLDVNLGLVRGRATRPFRYDQVPEACVDALAKVLACTAECEKRAERDM